MTEEKQKEILKKTANFCVYQERTQREVRQKLYEWGVYGEDAEEIIGTLIIERFLNEERFAKAFAGGKFRVKHWGRIKIKYELKLKGVSEANIKIGLKEIEDEDYSEKIQLLIERKLKTLYTTPAPMQKSKLANYLISKGFENDIVWEEIKAFWEKD